MAEGNVGLLGWAVAKEKGGAEVRLFDGGSGWWFFFKNREGHERPEEIWLHEEELDALVYQWPAKKARKMAMEKREP